MNDDVLDPEPSTVPAGFTPLNWRRGFGQVMGTLYERAEADGGFTRAFLVEERHTNGMQNCHGGMLMAFADMVFGHSVSLLRRDHHWITIRLLTDFIAPAALGDWVEGTSQIVGQHDDLYTTRGRIWVGDRTVLTGTGVFKFAMPRKAHG
ncbi:MAG: PaaI family thioesterase [Alphaproteobacteria bacterium]|nr:PaaI family thioesterase [Alphaproteobacteria bacterium]MDE2164063.1 PaaI family thioesterase [Alphaproteobacteria bacterium]